MSQTHRFPALPSALALLVSIGAACASAPSGEAPAEAEGLPTLDGYDFALDPDLRARPEQMVVVRLTPGVRHVVPFTFPTSRRAHFCWVDPAGDRHQADLVPAGGGTPVLSTRAGSPCEAAVVPAGDLDLVLLPDPGASRPGAERVVFVRFDPTATSAVAPAVAVPVLVTDRCEGCAFRSRTAGVPGSPSRAPPQSSSPPTAGARAPTPAAVTFEDTTRHDYCTSFNAPSYPYSLCQLPDVCGDSQMTVLLDVGNACEGVSYQVAQCVPGYPFFREPDDNDFMNFPWPGTTSLAGSRILGRPANRGVAFTFNVCGHGATGGIARKDGALMFVGLNLTDVEFQCDRDHPSDLGNALFYGNDMRGTRFTSMDGSTCGSLAGAVFVNNGPGVGASVGAGWTVDGVVVDGFAPEFLAGATVSAAAGVSLLRVNDPGPESVLRYVDQNGCPKCAKLGENGAGLDWSKVDDISGSYPIFECAFDAFLAACKGSLGYGERATPRRLHAAEVTGVPHDWFKEKVVTSLDAGGAILHWSAPDGTPKAPDLTQATFTGSTLSGVDFANGTLDGVTFLACRLQGATFLSASMKNAKLHNGTDISNANLDYADLTGADLTGVVGDQVQVHGRRTSFDFATLDQAIFRGARLGAFQETTAATFAWASAIGATFTAAFLAKADFSNAEASNAHFDSVKANGATFDLANLQNADLSGADFTGASFVKAFGCGAKLEGVVLANANLLNAYFPRSTAIDLYDSEGNPMVDSQGNTMQCHAVTGEPVSTDEATCPDGSTGPCNSDAQWVPLSVTKVQYCNNRVGTVRKHGASCQASCDCKSKNCIGGKCQ